MNFAGCAMAIAHDRLRDVGMAAQIRACESDVEWPERKCDNSAGHKTRPNGLDALEPVRIKSRTSAG